MSVTIPAREESELLTAVFRGLGSSTEEADIQADVLTEADLMGIHSHGLQRLPVLVKRIQKGLLKINVTPVMTWTADSVLCVDGKDGFGTSVAETSLRTATPAVRKRGVVVVAIRNSGHIGMVGYYCERRAREGLVSLGFTTSEALVHPFGGTEALIGTNPICIGIPSTPRPFVFDMATSTSALGKILAYKVRGEKLPEGWAIDGEGHPTTDPVAALQGSLTPAGGPKGSGLGVAIGILAGLLVGGEIGREVRGTLDVEFRATKSDLFILIDPQAFPGGPTLANGVRDYLEVVRRSRPQKGVKQVSVAGDVGYALREERCKNGIPHPEEVWNAAKQLHATHGTH